MSGALGWDGVAGAAGVQGVEGGDLFATGVEDAGDEFDGVGAAFVDLESGVTTAKTGDAECDEGVVGGMGGLGVGVADQRVDAASAADGEGVVFFGVEVEQGFAGEQVGLEGEGT